MKKCGIIVNPIAGMGGSVGLKGTDGKEILKKSKNLGARPKAHLRAQLALEKLIPIQNDIQIMACSGRMGEESVRGAGLEPKHILLVEKENRTTARDTRHAAEKMRDMKADIILFAGGDGTARDMFTAVGNSITTLGIPAGVKIHSAVFAQNPEQAGELAAMVLQGKIKKTQEAEVMDINETDYRNGILSAQLCGYLKIPFERTRLQRLKAGSTGNDRHNQEAIAHDIIERMEDDFYYIIGAGSTTKPIMELLKLPFSLLGVDVVHKKKLVGQDLSEKQILEIIRGKKAKIVVTPIGGQGFLFGRGNQQISAAVIQAVGKENILVASTKQKLNGFHGRPLLVDTGDAETDLYLNDHFQVITGYHEYTFYRIKH